MYIDYIVYVKGKSFDIHIQEMIYQSPSLVIFAEGKIFFKAAGTFPENDGSTATAKHYV